MNQPSERGYVGRFEARPKPVPQKRSAGPIALLILILVLVRLLATGYKVFSLADHFLSGSGLLIYGEQTGAYAGEALNSGDQTIRIVEDGEVPSGEEENVIIRRDNGKIWVYRGHTYVLNENLATVLFLGVDHPLNEEENETGESTQADVLLLIGIDTVTGRSTILNLSRDTYAQVDVYSAGGSFMETRYEQLALAYAYQSGLESCENTKAAVSRLLYGLPISSVIALDMEGIQAANEAVGGVTVKSLIDYESPDRSVVLREGENVELHGKALEQYIRTRSHYSLDANAARMARQKQYVTEFSKVVVKKSKQNLTFPVEIFSSLSDYMVTDLGLPDVTFLSTCFLENGANFTFRTIDGTYERSGVSAMFYPDDVDLFEAVLQVFYLQID